MSLLSRLRNVFQADRSRREIDEELESHIQEAIENGRDPDEVRRAFGSVLRHRERSRDVRVLGWLDSLRADAVFGWRQIRKNRATSATVVLSLGLAIGSSIAAFRLIDALLLRPLPIDHPERLYVIGRESVDSKGIRRVHQPNEYPVFREMRKAVEGDAELLAISYAFPRDLTFGSDDEMEKASQQHVSGAMFELFGLRAVTGRLLTREDDVKPSGHPYAVISDQYWARRFERDPGAIGETFRFDGQLFEIIGVVEPKFTGVDPGVFVDVYVPTMMSPNINRERVNWFRTFAVLEPGVGAESVRSRLDSVYRAILEERAGDMRAQGKFPEEVIRKSLDQTIAIEPASTGVSVTRSAYREALLVIAALAGLALLIACANVANLMSAQATARSREMALRLSIGAGRRRLVQLVLVESACLGLLAAALGGAFAWWAAPQVVGMINPPNNPARLALPADWRTLGFGLALGLSVTCLFGLAPALGASAVRPASALKGGEEPRRHRRLMHGLIAVQVTFCVVVTLAAGLFIGSLNRLGNQPLGFSADRLALVEVAVNTETPTDAWRQVAESLRQTPGVESVATASWPLMSRVSSNGPVWIDDRMGEVAPWFLGVSPDWADAMSIPLIDGRDIRPGEAGVALVNEAFAREYFGGQSPVGKLFERSGIGGARESVEAVGLIGDARYDSLRHPIKPTVYLPFLPDAGESKLLPKSGTFLVRTFGEPLALAPALRRAASEARPEFRVTNIGTQEGLLRTHTIRERLLAMLGSFFAVVALLLVGVGLYGVLEHTVSQRRREIGIRRALGAQTGQIVWKIAADVARMALVGAVVGGGLGLASVRYVEALLYGVEPTDASILGPTAAVVVAAAVLAALPPILRAIRINPAEILRAE